LLGRMDERMLRIEDHRGRWIRRNVLPMSPDSSVTCVPDRSPLALIPMAGVRPNMALPYPKRSLTRLPPSHGTGTAV
jgi:hypothetical protein